MCLQDKLAPEDYILTHACLSLYVGGSGDGGREIGWNEEAFLHSSYQARGAVSTVLTPQHLHFL